MAGAVVTLFPLVVAGAESSLAGRRPNIVFILTDDQGYGDLSVHGNPVLQTPHLDRVHAEGVRFTDFHVSPTCSPTRSALMTGRHEFKNGVTHTIIERERLTLDAVTLAQVLQSAGYRTGIFGKWHLGDEAAYQPDQRGFDEVFIHGGGGIGQTYPGSCGDVPGNTYFDPVIRHNGRFERTKGYCTEVFFGAARRWMDSVRGGDRPFFAYLALNVPHAPLQVSAADAARYAGKGVSSNSARFLGMVANLDDQVGSLLAQLRAWGLEENTLLVFMNDNGPDGGAPVYQAGMRGKKGTAYLGGTRAISLWRWPGTLRPADCNALAAHIDVLPTLAALAAAPVNPRVQAQVEGRSLLPLLENPGATWPDRTLFTHVGRWPRGADPGTAKFRAASVRTRQWHLVSPDGGTSPHWQLFDVSRDYGERDDVAARQPAVVAKLAAEYDVWWTEIQPRLVNERAVGPAVNPFKELYWKQFGGGPSAEDLRLMDSARNPATAPPGAVNRNRRNR